MRTNRGHTYTRGSSKSLTDTVKYLTVVMVMHTFLCLHHCGTLVLFLPISMTIGGWL